MEFLINQNNQFPDKYSKEDVQNLIDEKKIGLNTEIWTEQWGKWKQIKATDFDLKNAIRIEILTDPDGIEEERGIGWEIFAFLAPIRIESLTPSDTKGEEPGIGWKILAFLSPIAGLIMYFNNKNEFPYKAKKYAQLAGYGFALGILFASINRN